MNECVYGEFGHKPLIYERYIRIVKYWCNLLKQTNDVLTKSVYIIFKKKKKVQIGMSPKPTGPVHYVTCYLILALVKCC